MFQAGVGVVDITPPTGLVMAGFAARTAPASGVHDSLSVRALAVSDGARTSIVVSCDLVALEVEDAADARRRVRALVDAPGLDVVVTVTHTHGGPAVTSMSEAGAPDASYRERVLAAIGTAARIAWSTSRPALLDIGTSELHTVAHNRRGGANIDPKVLVARWRGFDGRALAVVFSHACHPVTLGPDNLLYTADWPGAARREIEMRGYGVALFLQGCCGQLNTGHSAEASFETGAGRRRSFAEAERIGSIVADAVCAAMTASQPQLGETVMTSRRSIALPLAEVPLPAQLSALEQQWAELAATADPPRAELLRSWQRWARRWQDAPVRPSELAGDISVHAWGEFHLVFLPCEPFVEFALTLRELMDRPELLVVGYADGVLGYVALNAEDVAAGGYELDQSYRTYGRPAPFAATSGRSLLDAALAALAELTEKAG